MVVQGTYLKGNYVIREIEAGMMYRFGIAGLRNVSSRIYTLRGVVHTGLEYHIIGFKLRMSRVLASCKCGVALQH